MRIALLAVNSLALLLLAVFLASGIAEWAGKMAPGMAGGIKHGIGKPALKTEPFFSNRLLAALSAAIFLGLLIPVQRAIRYLPSAALICFAASMLPHAIRDIVGRYNSAKIRKYLAEYISILNRWCSVREDIFYAFEKSLETGIKEPLNTYIRDMVIQVRSGMDSFEALDILQLKVNDSQFSDFLVNVKQTVKSRGDIKKLLYNMEEQFYRIEEEFTRRKIHTYRDKLVVYGIMIAVFAAGYLFIKTNSDVRHFYLATAQGKLLFSFFCMIYMAGAYIALGIGNCRY